MRIFLTVFLTANSPDKALSGKSPNMVSTQKWRIMYEGMFLNISRNFIAKSRRKCRGPLYKYTDIFSFNFIFKIVLRHPSSTKYSMDYLGKLNFQWSQNPFLSFLGWGVE